MKIAIRRFEAMTIQLTLEKGKVLYEEIDNDTDYVIYSHYIAEKNARKNYPLAFDN